MYKNSSTTESTAGATLSVDFDGRTGFNAVTIDTSADGTFYAAGNDYQVVLTAGTVGGTSVVGAVVGEFSIQNRTQYADVRKILGTASAGAAGYMGVDWGAVANPTTTVNLAATTVRTVTTLAANAIAANSFQNNSITGAALAASAVSTIATGVWQDTTAGDFTVAGSIGKSLFTSGNAPGAASGLALVGSNVGTISGTVTLATSQPNYAPAKAGDKMDLVDAPNPTAVAAIANGLLDLANAIDPSGGADTLRKATRLVLAACAGKLSGAGTATNTIRDTSDAKNRIVATVDSSGNRSAVTLDMT